MKGKYIKPPFLRVLQQSCLLRVVMNWIKTIVRRVTTVEMYRDRTYLLIKCVCTCIHTCIFFFLEGLGVLL